MRSIQVNTIISGVRALKDGSISFSSITPELTEDEKSSFFSLMNKNTKTTIEPLDETPESLLSIEKEVGVKTPSQRLRTVLYAYSQQLGIPQSEFNTKFYPEYMEKLIEFVKKKMDES